MRRQNIEEDKDGGGRVVRLALTPKLVERDLAWMRVRVGVRDRIRVRVRARARVRARVRFRVRFRVRVT